MLYYDPTESREKTNLPQNAIEYGKPIPDLEGSTGADLLIVPEIGLYEQVQQLQALDKKLIEISKTLDIKLETVINYSKPFTEYALPAYGPPSINHTSVSFSAILAPTPGIV